jgi:hypothetical protein
VLEKIARRFGVSVTSSWLSQQCSARILADRSLNVVSCLFRVTVVCKLSTVHDTYVSTFGSEFAMEAGIHRKRRVHVAPDVFSMLIPLTTVKSQNLQYIFRASSLLAGCQHSDMIDLTPREDLHHD